MNSTEFNRDSKKRPNISRTGVIKEITAPQAVESTNNTQPQRNKGLRKCLTDICPDMYKYWDYEKNDKVPDEYAGSSSEKVYTSCPGCGNSMYRTVRDSRKKLDDGTYVVAICKKCSKLTDDNKLITFCPDIVNYWVYDKNAPMTPENTARGSGMKIYTTCPRCGSELYRPVCESVGIDANGKPYVCSCINCLSVIVHNNHLERLIPVASASDTKQELSMVKNNLANACPDIKKYWCFDLNGNLTPEKVAPKSKTKAHVKCPNCGNIRYAQLNSLIRRKDDESYELKLCHPCTVKSLAYQNNVANKRMMTDYYPDIGRWYKPEDNNGIPLEHISIGTHTKYTFSCPRCNAKTTTEARLFLTMKKNGEYTPQTCTECGYSVNAVEPEKCVTNVCPEIVDWWDYEKNFPRTPDEFTVGNTTFKAHLTCPECRMCFQSYIRDAVTTLEDGSAVMTHAGKCQHLRNLRSGNNLVAVCPEILPYWDEQTNGPAEFFTIYINTSVSLKCPECSNSRNIRLSDALKKRVDGSYVFEHCPSCEAEEIRPKSFAALYPELAAECISDKDLFAVLPENFAYLTWKCHICGHEWNAPIRDRVSGARPCQVCAGTIPLPGVNSVAALYPELVDEIVSPVNLDHYFPTSPTALKWKCPTCAQEWYAAVCERVDGKALCPYCAGKKAIPGKTSLKARYPHIAAELIDSDKADYLLPTSKTRMRWHCNTCNMDWYASPDERTHETATCPYCSGKKAIPGKTSLKARYPDIMREWSNYSSIDPDKILPTSSKRVMWFCQYCGGHYEMAIDDRTRYYRRNKTACPKCKHHKRNTIFIF